VSLSCLLCARSGHCAIYSITSSARSIKGSGIFNPSAYALFRLMIISTLVTCGPEIRSTFLGSVDAVVPLFFRFLRQKENPRAKNYRAFT
jgi:hypothetical protein